MANRPAFIRLVFHLIHPVIFNGNSLRKEFLDLLYDFNKAVHFSLGVVKIKTRAVGRFYFRPLKTAFQIRRRENAGRW